MSSRKLRYAGSALGALMAVGLLAQPSNAATISPHQVRPAAADCTGHVGHTVSAHGVTLTFWSSPDGSDGCIGTIEVTATGPATYVEAYVENANGTFCLERPTGNALRQLPRRLPDSSGSGGAA